MDGFDMTKLTKEEQQEIEDQQLRDAIDADMMCPPELVTETDLRKLLGKRSATDVVEEDPKKKKMLKLDENQNEDVDNVAGTSKGKRGGTRVEEEKPKVKKVADIIVPGSAADIALSKAKSVRFGKGEEMKEQKIENHVADAAPSGTTDIEDVKKKEQQQLDDINKDVADAASKGKRVPTRVEEVKKKVFDIIMSGSAADIALSKAKSVCFGKGEAMKEQKIENHVADAAPSGTDIEEVKKQQQQQLDDINKDVADAALSGTDIQEVKKKQQQLDDINKDVADAALSKGKGDGTDIEEEKPKMKPKLEEHISQDVAEAAPSKDKQASTVIDENLKKQKLDEKKTQDMDIAAPSKSEGEASKEKEEGEIPITPPGSPRADDAGADAAPTAGHPN